MLGCFTDSETSMLPGIPGSAMCVQRFDDSLNSAIHITYRISLRSSSVREPRDPLLKVVFLRIMHRYIPLHSECVKITLGPRQAQSQVSCKSDKQIPKSKVHRCVDLRSTCTCVATSTEDRL